MRKENENKIAKDLNLFSIGNAKYTKNVSYAKGKNEKKSNPQLGKKRKRNNSIKISNENLECFCENEFNNIKSNNKQNEKTMDQGNKNLLIINEEENSTNFSGSINNAKKNNKKIQIESYKYEFDLSEENEIQQNSLTLWNNIMNIQDLSNEIKDVMKELKIDKKSIDTYNKLRSDILSNKITINRLNTMITFLSNSNIINLKRKIVEVLLFELFKNNQESFELLYYRPTRPNIEELKNLIYIKLKDNNEKYKKEIERLTELTNNNYDNKNAEPFIKIIEKDKKKKGQINLIFQFLKFCKKDLNPLVYASKETINFYLLPKHCLNNNFDEAKYFFCLDDILSNEFNSNESKKQNLTQINIPNELDIYSKKKILPVEEALDLLLSKNKIFNFINDDFSNEIKKKQIVLNESLKEFDNKFDIFSGIGILENSSSEEISLLKDDLLNANKEFIGQLDLFDSIISDIFCTPFNEEIANNIELIKQCINSDICSRSDIVKKIEKVNSKKADEFLCLKLFRLRKILEFLKKQKEKITHIYKSIYEENEKYYNAIIDKTQTLTNLANKKYNIKNNLLFEKWKKSGPRINPKYCKIDILRQSFTDLIKTIELDISYTYDEKFALWLIKNKFEIYLLN